MQELQAITSSTVSIRVFSPYNSSHSSFGHIPGYWVCLKVSHPAAKPSLIQCSLLGHFRTRLRSSCEKLINSCGRATSISPVPFTTTAFKFLDPITAPSPPRPKEFVLSTIARARRTRFSPDVPITITPVSGPSRCTSLFVTSSMPCPQRSSASMRSIFWSRILK
ncbi:hypothetical protein ES703_45527 [subsurface metagenome]